MGTQRTVLATLLILSLLMVIGGIILNGGEITISNVVFFISMLIVLGLSLWAPRRSKGP